MPFGVKLMLRWKAACPFNIKGCFYEKTDCGMFYFGNALFVLCLRKAKCKQH